MPPWRSPSCPRRRPATCARPSPGCAPCCWRLWWSIRRSGTITVRIGEENEAEEMRGTSVVSIGYGGHGTLLGGMGVVGPTRMDYPGTIAAVRAVANYVGE